MRQYPFCDLGVDAVTMRRDIPLGIPAVGLNQVRTRQPHQVHRSVEAGDHSESASKFELFHLIVRSFLSVRDGNHSGRRLHCQSLSWSFNVHDWEELRIAVRVSTRLRTRCQLA
jgi:hypothetical protein